MARNKAPERAPRMVERGILCVLIGAAVLLAPRFLPPSNLMNTVAGASVVGWFAVVLGATLIVVDLISRSRHRK
ncbi:hypothetical protein H7F36_13035 [Variovorax sp. PAMC28562]|jgi:uncharacterized membrane protein HdeD (DUF308 family)|uniref:hypothetical protein n=1 Tax=Variovorax sp. PAMC28562 TaxID=2762323 RepID=UPI00164E2B0D|nr:hypothetical protein [Variovorax sp. PAMC28562]MBC7394757.1 hypothetical protein [Variovorax sp.]QNK72157.1 hypothetical protein H7F36_13035 [Variovorax sp. PAMC28562]